MKKSMVRRARDDEPALDLARALEQSVAFGAIA